jgi:hypothetical protein
MEGVPYFPLSPPYSFTNVVLDTIRQSPFIGSLPLGLRGSVLECHSPYKEIGMKTWHKSDQNQHFRGIAGRS